MTMKVASSTGSVTVKDTTVAAPNTALAITMAIRCPSDFRTIVLLSFSVMLVTQTLILVTVFHVVQALLTTQVCCRKRAECYDTTKCGGPTMNECVEEYLQCISMRVLEHFDRSWWLDNILGEFIGLTVSFISEFYCESTDEFDFDFVNAGNVCN